MSNGLDIVLIFKGGDTNSTECFGTIKIGSRGIILKSKDLFVERAQLDVPSTACHFKNIKWDECIAKIENELGVLEKLVCMELLVGR